MTDELDTLRPEVREAINRQDRQERCDEYCPVCEDRATIRAELLRLADECATLKAQSIHPRAQLLIMLGHANECAEKAEGELAAIKARIAEGPSVIASRHPAGAVYVSVLVSERWEGKSVRLVVEE